MYFVRVSALILGGGLMGIFVDIMFTVDLVRIWYTPSFGVMMKYGCTL